MSCYLLSFNKISENEKKHIAKHITPTVSQFLSLKRPRRFDCNLQVFIRRWAECENDLVYTLSRLVISAMIGLPTRSVIGSISVFPNGAQPMVGIFDPTIPAC